MFNDKADSISLLEKIKLRFSALFGADYNRTKLAKKNIIISFIVRGLGILISLFIVPFTIGYVNPERYGIWLTVSSMIMWFNFFDLGLGSGLRNHLSAAIALDDTKSIKKLIGSSYASLTVISTLICILFLIANNFIEYDRILGIGIKYRLELRNLISVLFIFFCIQFILQLINSINYAFQKPANVSLISLLGNVFSLIFIVLFKITTPGTLLNLGIAYFSGTLLSLLGANVYFFLKRKDLIPSIKDISFTSVRNILNVGGKFFIIQIAAIVQYQTDNVLISRYFSPTDVTQYNIAYKLFNVVMMVFSIIMTPIWSAVTEAKMKNDFQWIKSIERRLLRVWFYFTIFSVVLLILSPYIYAIWLHGLVKVPFIISIGMMLYILSVTYGMIYVYILNGLGRLQTQFYISIITMVLFIPITYLLAVTLHLGIFGISLGLIIANANGLIAAPLEFRKIFKKY
jgi:O-antigen/teichoic acid export membrane protein